RLEKDLRSAWSLRSPHDVRAGFVDLFKLRRGGSMPAFFLRASTASLHPGALPGAPGIDRMNLLAADHSGASILASTRLDVLVACLNAGNVFVGLYSLDALVVLETLAALDVLDAFACLDALYAFVALDTLDTLNALNRFGTLNALNVLAASISELLLQIYI